ncbi:centromere protein Chl4/mis15/CENP-N [Lophiotrema nucula]|uniref:Centromere protein Chl4/mis15/CENP-N n=1 Tax=Lophiotrema nucula TaxID=690887 RepID=A0A6A5ZEF6_9PLEO|nr:centromere protein Chl4/mis15/CENP-N [Lophiotrema nucula]
MAPHASITAPDYRNIPHSHRLPSSNREVQRLFGKLSRSSLLSLAQQWLTKKNRDFCRPYLFSDQANDAGEETAAYEAAHSCEELIEIYKDMESRRGGRAEVRDRILEGDWRHGISMYQLATAEIQQLLDHPNALRWTAKRLAKIPNTKGASRDMEVTSESEHLPRFHAQTVMANLAKELTPLMKAHYLLTRLKTMPLTILRVYVHDSPYSSEASLASSNQSTDAAKAVYFIWPNGSPFVWISLATHLGQIVGEEARTLRDTVVSAIPKAFSRSNSRYQLVSTTFTTRKLGAMLVMRGSGKTNAAGGGWSIFADNSFSQNTLDFITTAKADALEKGKAAADNEDTMSGSKQGPGQLKRALEGPEASQADHRKRVAAGRFGSSAKPNDGRGLERFEVRIDDPFPTNVQQGGEAMDEDNARPSSRRGRKGRPSLLDRSEQEREELDNADNWCPDVRITFSGSHVFAGIRQLVEEGVVDGEKMPGWMTGEAGVTTGAVKNGRIRTKGSVPGV